MMIVPESCNSDANGLIAFCILAVRDCDTVCQMVKITLVQFGVSSSTVSRGCSYRIKFSELLNILGTSEEDVPDAVLSVLEI